MGQPGMPGSQFPGEDALPRKIKDLEREVQQFAAANVLATAGISAAEGGVLVKGFMKFLRENTTVGVQVDPITGTFTAYDAGGTNAVARFGALSETDPGEYGVEVLVGGTWVKLGAQAVTWDLVSGKPVWASDPGSIAGGNISGTVASASEASHAADADGSVRAYNNEPGGVGSNYAVWVDANFKLCRNTSSRRYKRDIQGHSVGAENVLQLQPVKYVRTATGQTEYGLIAEEVQQLVPELVTWFEDQIDGVRYDLLSVALLDVVQQQAKDIALMKQAIRDLGGSI